MTTPHIHADLIKAYADDTSTLFQFYSTMYSKWDDCVQKGMPLFKECNRYRIKPSDNVVYYALSPSNGGWLSIPASNVDEYYMVVCTKTRYGAEYPYTTEIVNNKPFFRS